MDFTQNRVNAISLPRGTQIHTQVCWLDKQGKTRRKKSNPCDIVSNFLRSKWVYLWMRFGLCSVGLISIYRLTKSDDFTDCQFSIIITPPRKLAIRQSRKNKNDRNYGMNIKQIFVFLFIWKWRTERGKYVNQRKKVACEYRPYSLP